MLHSVISRLQKKSFWLETSLVVGDSIHDLQSLQNKDLVIIGSGLTGASVGYYLKRAGFENIAIIDYQPESSASYRNCGHILYGTVESMKAMVEIHGEKKAKELWAFSTQACDLIETTSLELGVDVEYKREGYLVIAVSEVEDRECRESVNLLNSMGFESEYISKEKVKELGFKNSFGARYEAGSAQCNPVKFRNAVMNAYLKMGGEYYSNVKVNGLHEEFGQVEIKTDLGKFNSESVVIAANAYSPLFSDFFKEHGLIDPFRGQIMVSKPLNHNFRVKYPHSFDHGYEYALVTADNRLMLGGWRQNTTGGEVGTYSLETNPQVEMGLAEFAKHHYEIFENIEWDFSWSGIMAASKTGLPFIGPTSSPRIFACCAYTGHGLSWGHGSAKLLSQIILGEEDIPRVANYFNPKAIL